jgi:hypothetical protein
MKFILIASLILGTTFAQAADRNILDVNIPLSRSGDSVDTSFQMNTSTLQGSVRVTVTQQRYETNPFPGGGYGGGYGGCPFGNCYPGPGGGYGRPFPQPMPVPVTIYEDLIPVSGLRLEGKQVMYDGENGAINCGYLGYSRIFKVPTIYLSGKCSTFGNLDRRGNLTVTLRTK